MGLEQRLCRPVNSGINWQGSCGGSYGGAGTGVLDPPGGVDSFDCDRTGNWVDDDDAPVSKDLQKNRIVVVCPYGQLNVYFESELRHRIDDCDVDIVSRADIDEPPYIDVNEREREKPFPHWVIDFQRIIAGDPMKVVFFNGYGEWVKGKATYLIPVGDLLQKLRERHVYDGEGNFLHNSVRVADLLPGITQDLKRLIRGSDKQLQLFYKAA